VPESVPLVASSPALPSPPPLELVAPLPAPELPEAPLLAVPPLPPDPLEEGDVIEAPPSGEPWLPQATAKRVAAPTVLNARKDNSRAVFGKFKLCHAGEGLIWLQSSVEEKGRPAKKSFPKERSARAVGRDAPTPHPRCVVLASPLPLMKLLRQGFSAVCIGVGCGRALGLGSDVVWSTGFETGDLADWSGPPGTGGPLEWDAGGASPSVTPSTEQAHTGMYSVKFSSVAGAQGSPYSPGGACLYKWSDFPNAAYYSAWYFIPTFYETLSGWSIMKFMLPVGGVASDAGGGDASSAAAGAETTALGRALGAVELFDLSVLSLPNQVMTLVLFDARHQYLESPLPDPVPYLPIGRWFQIESFYRSDSGPDGELTVWLDGVPIYDIQRPTSGGTATVIFALCSLVNDLSPQSAVLYADDVAISWTRVTPHGMLVVPP
jgi:hypothetical protein